MPLKTYAQQLEEVQTAISMILMSGQDVQQGDERIKYADLAALQARESYLMPLVEVENGTAQPAGIQLWQGVPG